MPIGDDAVREIVRRKAHGDAIAKKDTNAVLSHPAREACANLSACVSLDIEIAASENVGDYSIEFKVIGSGHGGFAIFSL